MGSSAACHGSVFTASTVLHPMVSQQQSKQRCSLPLRWAHNFHCTRERGIFPAQHTLSGLPMSLTAVYLEEEGDEMLTNTFSFTFLQSRVNPIIQ